MNIRRTALSLAVVSALGGTSLLVSGGLHAAGEAATKTDEAAVAAAVVNASTDADEATLINTVDEAFAAIRNIRGARLAIFNGSPEEAATLVGQAQKDLSIARESLREHELMTQKSTNADDGYIPFDASMALAEGFVPSTEKASALSEANEHLSKGNKTEAVQALKLANIEVSVSAAMLPAAQSLKHVEDAVQLINDKKYYEANLALKAVEDSVIVESYDINAIPVQGSEG